MYRVYLFVIGICICCPLIGAKEPLPLLADPTPTVTLDMKRVPLQDILLEIEKQTGLFFSYESSMLKEFRHVSLTARDESLSYCLKRLFEPLPLVYRITGRYVILKRKLSPVGCFEQSGRGVGCPGKPGEIVAGPVGRNGCCQDFATATGCDRRNRRHEWLVRAGR